jgi:hypothetical protein
MKFEFSNMDIISKDQRENAWKINVKYSKDKIKILHIKKELGLNSKFSFTWIVKFVFIFNENGDTYENPNHISFYIDDYIIEEDTSLPNFSQLEKFFLKNMKSKKNVSKKIENYLKSIF